MDDGLLSLKWNNHKTTFFEILKNLREKSNFTDATLAVEGKFYPVHKLVMSTCSEYFSDIFERTPCKSPVIVLKDVRSHDIEALLDYMYIGEVNVNQNDLASLLKTAECLRIKGLAVPDEDPAKVRKNSTSSHDDTHRDSPPPPKRRRHDSNPIPPRAVSPVPSPQKSASILVNPAQIPSIPTHSTSNTLPRAEQEEPPVVKVEMDDEEEQEEQPFRRENNYEGGASSDRDPSGDYGSDLSKTEHEPENYGNASFPGPSLQQGGDSHWDEGDSSSFPPESYSGDVPSSHQAQGASYLAPPNGWLGCHLCSVVCGSANDLRRHIMTHTGEKPHKCPFCEHRTARRYNLKKHLRDLHGPSSEIFWENGVQPSTSSPGERQQS